jgi:hypothetical protein
MCVIGCLREQMLCDSVDKGTFPRASFAENNNISFPRPRLLRFMSRYDAVQ